MRMHCRTCPLSVLPARAAPRSGTRTHADRQTAEDRCMTCKMTATFRASSHSHVAHRSCRFNGYGRSWQHVISQCDTLQSLRSSSERAIPAIDNPSLRSECHPPPDYFSSCRCPSFPFHKGQPRLLPSSQSLLFTSPALACDHSQGFANAILRQYRSRAWPRRRRLHHLDTL